jgi:DNA-binding MarR family transcriptional regulator
LKNNSQQQLHRQLLQNIQLAACGLDSLILKTLRPHGITPQQFGILRALFQVHPQPSTVKFLMSAMPDPSSNASRLIDKLKSKGYLEKNIPPDDQRKMDVLLTSSGLDVYKKFQSVIDAALQEKLDVLNASEVETLNALLLKFT